MAGKEEQRYYDVDARKYRKSTHLASADVEMMIASGKRPILTIKQAWYATDTNVNGTKTDGYFCEFVEPGIKNMALNSSNRAQLVLFKKIGGMSSIEANDVRSWAGLRIELYVDNKVKFAGKIVDGIRISPTLPVEKVKPAFTEDRFAAAFEKGATIESIELHFTITPEIKKAYAEYGTKNG